MLECVGFQRIDGVIVRLVPTAKTMLSRISLHLTNCDVERFVTRATEVVCTEIWLARWKCRQCGRTFTDYPDFRTAV